MHAPAPTAPIIRLTPQDYSGPQPVGTATVAVAKRAAGNSEEPNKDQHGE